MCLAEENEAHSEDERDPNFDGERYLIHQKEGRNPMVTSFFHFEDQRYLKASKRRTGARYVMSSTIFQFLSFFSRMDRTRVTPESSIAATVNRFPVDVPIDYFEPLFYNQMSVRERAIYMQNGVAFPVPEICADRSRIGEWKNLSTEEFMEKFGNDTLKLYNLPTEAELEQLGEYDEEEENEDGEDED